MNQTMEKFINFKQLNVVKTGTSTANGSTTLKLTDAAATFTQTVLVNAIVWDRVTNAANGGQKYLVTVIDSDTELTLLAIGPTSDQGTGVPDATAYFIYMPEYTVLKYGTTSATLANFLVDSGVNFILSGVKPGDYVRNITDGVVTLVTSVAKTTLGVSDDIFTNNENYLVYKEGADDYKVILRSSGIADVSNDATTSSEIEITYNSAGSSLAQIDYAYSSTVGANSAMRGAIQEAITSSLETEWTDVSFDFPGLLNPEENIVNTTWLAGQDFFFLRIQ